MADIILCVCPSAFIGVYRRPISLNDILTVMHASELEAVVEGRHHDPFAVLGPHHLEIRAWLPHAVEASVVIGDEEIIMERIHPSGFYVATLETPPEKYRLHIDLYSGESLEFEDPYRFP